MLRSKRELSAMRYPLAKITAAALVAGLSLVASSCRTSGNERPELVAQETTRASRPEVTTVRPTAVAGPRGMGFYTDDEAQLREQVEGFLRDVPETELDGELVALMVPHAGLVYSGPIAAYSYRTLADRQISRIVLIGNSHTASFAGVAVSPDAAWDTPLGPVTVDRDAVEQLLDIGAPFSESRRVHANEHCLEVQLPFIKAAVPDATIVPMLISRPSTEEIAEIADALLPLIQEPGTILVASSDMAHYPVYDEAVKSDRALLDAIVTLDPEQIAAKDDEMMGQGVKELHCTLCGLESVLVAVTTANQMGDAKATVLDYRNSGDTAGDKGRCVGYGAVAFTVANTEDAPSVESGTQTRDASGLTDADRIRLLKVARQTLEAELDGGDMPSLDPGDSAALAKETACFVTLKMDGKLRGCIGELE
ncbi:MAG TPA: AmmeMemoRadiSam system protein B, partial [Armatimonadota bacterium]|nr:AmmeMemoRadiSam system protein B [Armatimonadota bacterium]